MQFPTLEFAVFFTLVFSASWALYRYDRVRKVFLLGASYVFYACADWGLSFLLAGSTFVNWLGAREIARYRSASRPRSARNVLVAGVLINLGVLAFFKYTGFGIQGANSLLALVGFDVRIPYLALVLPVGISFFTFQGLSLLVDVYRGELPKAPGALDAFLYIAFFPQLVAGPIVRASDFLPQLSAPPNPRAIQGGKAFALIAGGLFKKIALAGPLGTLVVDPVFANPGQSGGLELILAVCAYGAQIYCDFSAYSDIAIGLALMLGYEFPPNFDSPYRAASLTEFWRRWHISLSSWLRDYLYIPLGGNRLGRIRTLLNLFATMVLGGLWHGASLGFVLWGALHGLGLVCERLLGYPGKKDKLREGDTANKVRPPLAPWAVWLARAAGFVWTFVLVQGAWVFFRAESIEQAGEFFAGFTRNWDHFAVLNPTLLVLLVVVYAVQWTPVRIKSRLRLLCQGWPAPVWVGAAAVMAFVLGAASQDGMASFIYFRF